MDFTRDTFEDENFRNVGEDLFTFANPATLSFDFGAEPEYLETANNDEEEGEANNDEEEGEANIDEEGGEDNIYEEGERIIFMKRGERIILTKRRKILLQEMIIVLYWILKQLQ